jgi:hypothetical protein
MKSPRPTGLTCRLLVTATLLGLFITASSSASAAFVNAKWSGSVSPGLTVSFSTNSGSSWTTTRAGVYNWTAIPAVDWVGDSAGKFWTMCIELREHTPSSGQSYLYHTALLEDAPKDGLDVGGGGAMGAAKADALRELFGYLSTVHSLNFESDSVPALTNRQAAAIHLAIWEIVYEDSGTWGTTTGDTRFTGDTNAKNARGDADGYLAAIHAGNYTRATNIMALTDDGDHSKQDQLFFLNDGWEPGPNGDVNFTPVPPAFVLALLGVVPAGLMVRRSRRTAVAG